MRALIGVVAPNVGDGHYNSSFRLRMKHDGHELTLRNLHTIFHGGFDREALHAQPVHDDFVVPASGYYLTGLLRANGYDTCMTATTDPQALEGMARRTPLAVCVSTSMVVSIADLKSIVDRLRAAMPEVAIIVGGPLLWKTYTGSQVAGLDAAWHESSVFSCARSELDVDVMVVSPHGATILLDVLDKIERGTRAELADVPNLAVPNGSGRFVLTRRVEEPVDWDADYTRWDLVDQMPARVPIRTSIGCPHRCEFCDFCRLYPRVSLRSTASLADELALIKARVGRAILHVTDDIVFANRRRLREVCQTIIDSGAAMMWGGFLRPASFLPDEMELVRKSRFRWAVIGVESGDQEQLDRMHKQQKVEVLRRCIETLDRADVASLLTMVIGFPGEDDKTLANTIEFLETMDLANSSYELFPLWVFPLSGLASRESRERWDLTGIGGTWRHRTMDRAGAEAACALVFRAVRGLAYNYPDESVLFNSRWPRERRRELFDLRRRLTVQLMDRAQAEAASATVEDLARRMGFTALEVPDHWVDQIGVETIEAAPAAAVQTALMPG